MSKAETEQDFARAQFNGRLVAETETESTAFDRSYKIVHLNGFEGNLDVMPVFATNLLSDSEQALLADHQLETNIMDANLLATSEIY